jgi:hypothetical protein
VETLGRSGMYDSENGSNLRPDCTGHVDRECLCPASGYNRSRKSGRPKDFNVEGLPIRVDSLF